MSSDHSLPAPLLSILLVEDSPSDALLLKESLREPLERGELSLQLVRSLAEAEAELRRRRYVSVLLDLGLPDGHGLADVERLRSLDSRLTVVVLTGLDCESSAIRALQLGAQEYVVKGQYDGERLLKVVRHAVERNRQMGELEVRRAEQFAQASHDPVTGLMNRKLFEERAHQGLSAAQASGQRLALCFLDLDRFKAVNDRHGHGVGDAVLAAVAQILRDSVRESDTVARIGGDEFAILLTSTGDPRRVREVGERIVERIRALDQVNGHPLQIGCSLGIAHFPENGTTFEALLHHSDIAMYRAKTAGGGVMAADDQAPAATSVMDRFVADVHGALAEGRFEVYFQPWADFRLGRFVGLEALLRWRRPEGLQLPQEFLPQLNASGLLPDLGLQVARMAARECRRWRDAGLTPGVLGLNLSVAELLAPDHLHRLLRVLVEEDMAPGDVQIELDAATLNVEDPRVLSAIHRFDEAGLNVLLEGFAPGRGVLLGLSTPGVKGLKLDREIWHPGTREEPGSTGARFLAAVLGAASALQQTVFFLGVESPDDLRALRPHPFRCVQGHWLCPPLAAADLPDSLNAGLRRLKAALQQSEKMRL